jgi:hypothetical protein
MNNTACEILISVPARQTLRRCGFLRLHPTDLRKRFNDKSKIIMTTTTTTTTTTTIIIIIIIVRIRCLKKTQKDFTETWE